MDEYSKQVSYLLWPSRAINEGIVQGQEVSKILVRPDRRSGHPRSVKATSVSIFTNTVSTWRLRAGAVHLAKCMTPTDQRHRLGVVKAHTTKGVADIRGTENRIGVSQGSFGVDVCYRKKCGEFDQGRDHIQRYVCRVCGSH